MAEQHKCGECAYWLTPTCPFFDDAKKGILKRTDDACEEFYPQPRRRKEKQKPAPHKFCGLSDQGLFEAIYHKGKPAFLVKTSEGFKVLDSLTNDGEPVAPKELNEFPYEPYGFYEKTVPNREELFWKVRHEFDIFLDVEPIWKDVGAACVLFSYQQEKLMTVPYIFTYGDNESGKSSFLGVLNLCYRPLSAVTIPVADVYGYLDDSDAPGTILEDEIQGIDKDWDKIKVYKAGYAQGARVPRTFILERKRFIKYFRCFCFKAFAAEKIPTVKGFNERCIFISMIHGEPEKAWTERDADDKERLQNLRNMLLKWRLASIEWQLPELELPFKGRMRELWKPILQITHGLPVYEELLKFAMQQAQERLMRKQNTLEGHLVKAVAQLVYEKGRTLPFSDIWDSLVLDLNAKTNYDKPNKMDTPEFGEITKQLIGYRLREVLNGKKKNYRSKGRVSKLYVFQKDKVNRLARSYGFKNFVAKLPSLLSPRGVTVTKNNGKPMENNVESMEKTPEKPTDTPLEVGKLGYLATDPFGLTMKSEDKASLKTESLTMKNEVKVLTDLSVPVKLVRLTTNIVDTCMNPNCRFQGRMDWQTTYPDGSWGMLCYKCGLELQRKIREAE